ncbi:MAG: hypothetical protein R3230_01245 [Nitrosopumilaceae archaeon]|nr:hypothetical protein [Nitrosopumilaceae archaeon]
MTTQLSSEEFEWDYLSEQWKEISKQLNTLKEKEAFYREKLIAMCNGQTTQGNGIKVQKITRKGSVDYKEIPELKGVDIEIYRKESVISWKISPCL